MAKSDRPLSIEERAVIASSLQTAMTWMGVGRTPPTPAQIHDLVNQAIDNYRLQSDADRAHNLEEGSSGFGALWGQVLCDQFGWVWIMMQNDKKDDAVAVVTSTRSHVIYPIRFIHKILASPANEQLVDKIFKQIQTNKLPKSLPRGYLVVGGGGKSTTLI